MFCEIQSALGEPKCFVKSKYFARSQMLCEVKSAL